MFYENFRRFEAQDFCECLELIDGRGVFLSLKVAEYGAVHTAGSSQLGLGHVEFFASGYDGLG